MKTLLQRLFRHEELSREEACRLMQHITKGDYNDSQLASFLTVYQMRNITVDELIGFRDALLSTRLPVDLGDYHPLDIVGTGGDGKNTFNISTCACFVVAGAGYYVAKHGNYGATSVSGASNVMQCHGVKFTNDEAKLRRSLEQCHMAYLHAPLFNSGMKAVAAVRKALGVRTLFNLLGPLVNPCLPDRQLLGVANLPQMRLYAYALQKLGTGFTIVNSFDGYDEISLTGDFKIMTDHYETIHSPESLGFGKVRPEELQGGDTPEDAARIFDAVLQGRSTRAQSDCVVANAAFAIQTADPDKRIEHCVDMARESIRSGAAWNTFCTFVELNS